MVVKILQGTWRRNYLVAISTEVLLLTVFWEWVVESKICDVRHVRKSGLFCSSINNPARAHSPLLAQLSSLMAEQLFGAMLAGLALFVVAAQIALLMYFSPRLVFGGKVRQI